MGKAFISPAPTSWRGSRFQRLGVVKNGLLALGIAAGTWTTPAGAADTPEGSYVIPGSKAAGLENCVRETPFMRRNHMDLIEHQRDETVHRGIRKTDDSLAGCIDCHVGRDQQGQPMPVYAEGQFCRTCHELAAVKINCFDCHATIPVLPGTETAKTAGTKTPRITPKVE